MRVWFSQLWFWVDITVCYFLFVSRFDFVSDFAMEHDNS